MSLGASPYTAVQVKIRLSHGGANGAHKAGAYLGFK